MAQLTIEGLIEALHEMPQDLPIVFPDGTKPQSFGSYRGYYDQFAVGNWYGERTDLPDSPTVGDFIDMLGKCVYCPFRGYKGGSFVMLGSTPIWHSNHGCASETAIVGVTQVDNKVIIQTKETQ